MLREHFSLEWIEHFQRKCPLRQLTFIFPVPKVQDLVLGSLGRGCHKTLLPNDCRNFDGVRLRSSRNVWTPLNIFDAQTRDKIKTQKFSSSRPDSPETGQTTNFSPVFSKFSSFSSDLTFSIRKLETNQKIQFFRRSRKFPHVSGKFPHVWGKFPHVWGKFPHVAGNSRTFRENSRTFRENSRTFRFFTLFCHFPRFFRDFPVLGFFPCFRGQTSQNWKTPKFGIFSGSKAGFPRNTFLMSANPI